MTLVSNTVTYGQPVEVVYTHSAVATIKFTIKTTNGVVVNEAVYRLERGTHVVPMSTTMMARGRTYVVTTWDENTQDAGQQTFYLQ